MFRYCRKHYAKFCLFDEDATSLKGSWQANEDICSMKKHPSKERIIG
jgi:hypothetical protein